MLRVAVIRGELEMVENLIAWGADVDSEDTERFTQLHSAVMENRHDIF